MSASRSARSFWTERLAVAVAAVALSLSVAAAQPSPVESSIEPPADWPEQPELAEGIAKQLQKTVDFGGLETAGGASAFVKAQTGVLYVSWLATTKPADKPEAAIRAALDQLRASIEGTGEAAELDYAELRSGQAVEVKRIWRHVANETITMSRTFAYKSPDARLNLVRGECVYAETDQAAVAPICDKALSTLTTRAIAGGQVGELGPVAGPAPAPGSESPAPGSVDGGAAAGPSIGPVDPNNPPRVLYQGDKKKEGGSNLWLFIAGGALIVFAFWMMTRGRSEGEGEDEGEAAEPGAGEEEE